MQGKRVKPNLTRLDKERERMVAGVVTDEGGACVVSGSMVEWRKPGTKSANGKMTKGPHLGTCLGSDPLASWTYALAGTAPPSHRGFPGGARNGAIVEERYEDAPMTVRRAEARRDARGRQMRAVQAFVRCLASPL